MANIADFFGGQPFNAYDFNLDDVQGQLPVSGSEGLPVVITDSPLVESRNKPGSFFIELHLTVIDGEHTGAEGVWRLNVRNENATAERIAWESLAKVAAVIGCPVFNATEELHGQPFRVVTVEKNYTNQNGEVKAGSEVKKVLDIDGNSPKKGESAPAQASGKPQFSAPAVPTAPAAPATRQFVPKSAPASDPAPAGMGARPPFPFAKKG
jgi:hypothetical protein